MSSTSQVYYENKPALSRIQSNSLIEIEREIDSEQRSEKRRGLTNSERHRISGNFNIWVGLFQWPFEMAHRPLW